MDLMHVDVAPGDALTAVRNDDLSHGTDFLDRIRFLLAGRAAEEIVCGCPTAGAIKDLDEATAVAIVFHTRFGWGCSALVSIAPEVAKYDRTIRDHTAVLLDHIYRDCLDFVIDRKVLIRRLAKALHEHRFLDADEVVVALKSPLFNRQDDFGDPASADVPWSGVRRLAA